MAGRLARAAIAMTIGALVGAAALIAVATLRPAIVIEMDRHLPREAAAGFYPPELAGDLTFAWTSRQAVVFLHGLDRRHPWICRLRFRGDGPKLQQTQVAIEADGVVIERAAPRLDFQDLPIRVPARPGRPGLTLGITSSETFVPGPQDRRELGVQVDWLVCAPEDARLIVPPARAIAAAAGGTAFGAAALVLGGAGLFAAIGAAALLAAAHAALLSSGLAAYGGFPSTLLWSAGAVSLVTVALSLLLRLSSTAAATGAATFAVFVTAAAIHLKLLGLLHPSKLLVDAVFHAHRLEWVLAGRYFFTQPLPSGVTFPYAIGLYVFASPWTFVTHDYVSLLRIIVVVAESLGALLLYPLIVRAWGSRWTAAAAVALFHTIPLPYGIVGNANLTNAFGQAVSLVTLVVVALGPFARRRWLFTIGLWALASLAFLSHISTFAQLFTTMLLVSVFYGWKGDAAVRRAARTIAVVTLLAGAFATATYYGHFGDVYRTALKIRADRAAAVSGEGSGASAGASVTLSRRVADAAALTRTMLGTPMLLLAALGIWYVWSAGSRDPLTLLLAGWGLSYLVFFAVGVVPSIDAPFQRYAAEFVGRVNFAAYPAVAVLGARAACRLWSGPLAAKFTSVALIVLAVASGVRHWAGWFT